jgi:hypothetical protein
MAAPKYIPIYIPIPIDQSRYALTGHQVTRDMAAPTYMPIYIPIPTKKPQCSDWLPHQEGHGDPTYIPIYIPIPIEKSQCSDWLSDQDKKMS